MADDKLYERGLEIRKQVLGAAHVERSLKAANDFTRDFQTFITQYAWGGAWARGGSLDKRTRSLLTIAMLAALGREEELRLHIHATRNTGVSPDEVKEALIQVAIYGGVPAANAAFRAANEEYQKMAKENPA
jgi:4-carboxymuconolactone decarboxylase